MVGIKPNESPSLSRADERARFGGSLALLMALAVAAAVLVSMFGRAVYLGKSGASLDEAVYVATKVAERFSADPTTVATESVEGGYRVICDIIPERTEAGTLYMAIITVWDDDTAIYTIQTAKYLSEVA